jgi:hypothetical protein
VDKEPCPLFIGYGIAGNRVTNHILRTSHACRIAASRFGLEHPRPHALCSHRLPSAEPEEPPDHREGKSSAGEHPWYANQWQARPQDVPVADHGVVLFMQAARWPDDVRIRDKQHHRGPWHYINWPFKPETQPDSVQISEPQAGEHPG